MSLTLALDLDGRALLLTLLAHGGGRDGLLALRHHLSASDEFHERDGDGGGEGLDALAGGDGVGEGDGCSRDFRLG